MTKSKPITDDDLQKLLRAAGPRSEPPTEVRERVRAATLDAWEALPEKRPQRPRTLPFALAASVFAAFVLGFIYLKEPAPGISPVGEIVFASGAYSVRGGDELAPPQIAPGAMVGTSAEGHLFVALSDAISVRFDSSTRATLHDGAEIWLHQGRLYIDANEGQAGSVRIITDDGATITDVGTIFEVEAHAETVTIVVREGAVDVAAGVNQASAEASAGKGEALAIVGLDIERRGTVATTAARWNWVEATRPPFDAAGRKVYDFLAWAARETGRELVFEGDAVEQQARLAPLVAKGANAQLTLPFEAVFTDLTKHFRIVETDAPHVLKIGFNKVSE